MLRYGTIGTSWITEKFILAAKEANSIELGAVFSRSIEKALNFAGKHGAQDIYTDLDTMAKSSVIDCVYIASPNSFHFEQAILFLKNKKHVICEKPIFRNKDELEYAYQVAEEKNVYLFEAIRNIHIPNLLQIKKNMTKVGKIGSVFFQRIRYSSKYDEYLKGEEPNVFSMKYGGGALVDLGVYPISLAVTLFGKPTDVSYSAVKLRTGVDGGGTLILQYTDFFCTIMCSKMSTSYNASEIHGEKGIISIDDVGKLSVIKYICNEDKQRVEIGRDQSENDMMYEIETFTRIIKTNDDEEYNRLKRISTDILSITEEARKQNGLL